MEGNTRYLAVLTILVLTLIMQASSDRIYKKAIPKCEQLVFDFGDHWNNSRQAELEALFTDDFEFYLDNVPEKRGKAFLGALTQYYAKVNFVVREIKSLVGNKLFMIVTDAMLIDENDTHMLLNDATGITLARRVKGGEYKAVVFAMNSVNKTPETIARQAGK